VALQAIDQQGIPAQATLTIVVAALPAAIGPSSPGRNWLLMGGIVALLLMIGVGGYYTLRAQRRQAALAHQRAAALELRRARRIPQSGVRPGDPRWGDPRAGARVSARGAPPSGARRPASSGPPPGAYGGPPRNDPRPSGPRRDPPPPGYR
jgi:hypothetical protein